MVKSDGKKTKQRKARAVQLSKECWVDLYELPWFNGKLHRLRGPGQFDDLRRRDDSTDRLKGVGSIIVGPDARIERINGSSDKKLRPKQIVPDIAEIGLAGKLKAIEVSCVKAPPSKAKTPARRSRRT